MAAQTKPDLPRTVRVAATFLVVFAVLNVARESTYLIGSIQRFGAPQPDNYEGMAYSITSLALGGMAAGLRGRSTKAWWAAIIGSGFFLFTIGNELMGLLVYRARGGEKTDLQIVFLVCAIVMLIAAIVTLLMPASIKTFWTKASASAKNTTAYDVSIN